MSFVVCHVDGSMESDPSVEVLATLVKELEDSADLEHPDVSVSDESGWTLSAYRNGLVTWENVEDEEIEPRHMSNVARDQVVKMFETLATGDVETIEAYPWMPGYY